MIGDFFSCLNLNVISLKRRDLRMDIFFHDSHMPTGLRFFRNEFWMQPTFALFNDLTLENLKEIFVRLTLPIFCVVSFIFSVIFASYSAFFGREKTYFFLAIFNILYLLLALSSFEVYVENLGTLVLNFYWMHLVVLIFIFILTNKNVKKGFGYEGI